MSENIQASIGQILQDAREAKGITLENAAKRLRLMQRQVEAMEADDFESLGQPVFARGFVRNYARLLEIASEPLLERMEGAPAEPAEVNQVEPPPTRSWLVSPWFMLLMLGVLVVVAAPVALYLWLNSDVESSPSSTGHVTQIEDAPVENHTVVAPVAATLQEAPAAPPTETPVASAVEESPASGSVVSLEFGDESWVEIRDASGRMLHRQLNQPGSLVEVRGQPPFDLVIGNAAQARMTYNGRPIDLKPFIDVTVARFTLEE